MADIRSQDEKQKDTADCFYDKGRYYGKFKRGAYLLPVDGTEQDRLDILHTMIKTARDPPYRLLHAPTFALSRRRRETEPDARVLDLGCGTGIWLLEMAEEYPQVIFTGVDINAMGPMTILPNVEMRVPWDMESPWAMGDGYWDIIHLQMGLGAIQNWRALYANILRHLQPGTGYFESVEIDWQPRCSDGTLKSGILTQWWERYVSPAYQAAHCPITYNPDTARELAAAGFQDIEHRVYTLPLNGWAQKKVEHRTGMWFKAALSPGYIEAGGLNETGGHGIEALSLAPLTRIYDWSEDHAQRLCREALQEACDPSIHAYNELHIYWARAPRPNEH